MIGAFAFLPKGWRAAVAWSIVMPDRAMPPEVTPGAIVGSGVGVGVGAGLAVGVGVGVGIGSCAEAGTAAARTSRRDSRTARIAARVPAALRGLCKRRGAEAEQQIGEPLRRLELRAVAAAVDQLDHRVR